MNKDLKKQSSALISCMAFIVLLMMVCFFGINNSKETYSATTNCPSGYSLNSDGLCYSDTCYANLESIPTTGYVVCGKNIVNGSQATSDINNGNLSNYNSLDTAHPLSQYKMVSCSDVMVTTEGCPDTSYPYTYLCQVECKGVAPTTSSQACYTKNGDYDWTATPGSGWTLVSGKTTEKTCLQENCQYAGEYKTQQACQAAGKINCQETSPNYCWKGTTPTTPSCYTKNGDYEWTATPGNGWTLVSGKTTEKTCLQENCQYTGEYKSQQECQAAGKINCQETSPNYCWKGTTPTPTPSCYYTDKTACENGNTNYNCKQDSNNCWIKGDAKTYNITYSLDGGSTQSSTGLPSTYKYGVGTTINGSATKANYTFKGWATTSAKSDCKTQQTISTTASGNKTMYACWEANATETPKSYTATYINGSSTTTKTCTETTSGKGCAPDLPANPTSTTKDFKGWGDKNSCVSGFTSKQTITQNKTYYACWEDKIVTPTCTYDTQSKCEAAYSGFNCTKNSSNCWEKGSAKCTYTTKKSCEDKFSGFNCKQDANSCWVQGDKKNIENNPKTGSAMIVAVWIIGAAMIVYSAWYFKKSKQTN